MDAQRQGDSLADWHPIETAPEGVLVITIISDDLGPRNKQPLKRQGRLWFYPDGITAVRYTPTHWKPLQRVRDVVDSSALKETA